MQQDEQKQIIKNIIIICPAPDEIPFPSENLGPLALKKLINQWPEMMTKSEWHPLIKNSPGAYECPSVESTSESCGGCVDEIGKGKNCMLIDHADGELLNDLTFIISFDLNFVFVCKQVCWLWSVPDREFVRAPFF